MPYPQLHYWALHHLNPLRINPPRRVISSINKLYELPSSHFMECMMRCHPLLQPPTSMHPQKIAIPSSWEVTMAILRGCIELVGEGDTSSYIPWSGRMVTSNDSCMDEVNVLRGSIWGGETPTKVVASIPVSDLSPSSMITFISNSFLPICTHTWNYSQKSKQWKCMTWLNVTSCYSLNGNGCPLLMEIVVIND